MSADKSRPLRQILRHAGPARLNTEGMNVPAHAGAKEALLLTGAIPAHAGESSRGRGYALRPRRDQT
ncbi:hypothetical protein Sxan_78190 [Streptomyces xanthophaeus]|uniref:Uncharacterized protein n=1 Tax=Streptomyces xanthophaeus TaxID=67385 RepID=A0A919LG83_9ACTN|nr:hypothetical protein Sxan_78190 [Streptomyces xanthophaeus]